MGFSYQPPPALRAMKNPTFPSRNDFQTTYSKPKLPLSWPSSLPSLVPHRIRRKLRSKIRSRQSPSSSFATLQTSASPVDTLRSLRAHRWSFYDVQYLILIVLVIFSLSIIPARPLVKAAIATAMLVSVTLPLARQFFLPFWPIGVWLIFYYACG